MVVSETYQLSLIQPVISSGLLLPPWSPNSTSSQWV